MKVLVCTVGGSPEPVVKAVQANRPDFVYFVCSTGGGGGASDRTIDHPIEQTEKGRCPSCGHQFEVVRKGEPLARRAGLAQGTYEVARVSNPDDLDAVLHAMAHVEAGAIERAAGGPVEVIVNYTGGTKTMSVGAALHAIERMRAPRAGFRWDLQLNAGLLPRENLIRMTHGDVPVPQRVSPFLVDAAARRADELERSFLYEAALATIEDAVRECGSGMDPERTRRIGEAHVRCRMLAAWDRFDYAEALTIAQTDATLRAAHEVLLKRLVRARDLVTTDNPWSKRDVDGLDLVRDLLANADRCAARRRFDDAAGRYYRATELLAQVRLRREYGIRTADVDPAKAARTDEDRAWLEGLRGRGAGGKPGRVQLPLFQAYELLHRLGDPLGAWFDENRAVLQKAIEVRNQSLFAHGFQPIDEAVWERAGAEWRRWIEGGVAVLPGA